MHIRAVHVHIQMQFLAHAFDVLEALLVVGPCTADPDLGLVLDQRRGELSECADDTFECGGNLSSISAPFSSRLHSVLIELTFVKLAIPPPIKRTLPSGCIGARSMRSKTVRA